MESEDQRRIRRTISAWLTKRINNARVGDRPEAPPAFPALRGKVITALAGLNRRLLELSPSLVERFRLKPDQVLVRFYMKGGNAFACVHDPQGSEATELGGGESDWDTQIVVDPWAPPAVQDALYGLIEEIVMDELLGVGPEVANSLTETFSDDTIAAWAVASRNHDGRDFDGRNLSQFTLTFDQQTVRQVFDRDRLGLWMSNLRKISAPGFAAKKRIPGLLFNDAIHPFCLYRLGFTWHATLQQPPPPIQEGDPARREEDMVQIKKPLLMELIDVTLPRRDTIEAVAVWEELSQNKMRVDTLPITVTQGLLPVVTADLPFPDIMYHVREISTMLCEVADGSSHHKDKLPKRFQRFKLIWDEQEALQGDITSAVNAISGVANILVPQPHQASVTAAIQRYGGRVRDEVLADTDPAYTMARRMMDEVASRSVNNDFMPNGSVSRDTLERFKTARQTLTAWLQAKAQDIPHDPGLQKLCEATLAFSDDLLLVNLLEENGYLDARLVGFSGVDQAAVVRVRNRIALDYWSNLVRVNLPEGVTVHWREHNTLHAPSASYEVTTVYFMNGHPFRYLTLTTATPAESPFKADPGDYEVRCAPARELASQRKVAAALIEEYVVRTALGRQYDALRLLR